MNKRTLLFTAGVLLQIMLLLLVPFPRWMALTMGRTIVLETAPVDPYAVFQGYYARLNYQISQPENLPFAKSSITPQKGHDYYILLSPSANGVWEPRQIFEKLPKKLNGNEVALKGNYRNKWMMEYGIGQYYLPEHKRSELEKLLRDINQKMLVTVKVGPGGQGAIVKLQAGGKEFMY